jgi:predicted nucleotide-binding protein
VSGAQIRRREEPSPNQPIRLALKYSQPICHLYYTHSMPRPKVFIGSSTEQLETAYVVAKLLDSCADAIVWDKLEFAPGLSIFDKLLNAADQFDFAVFIFKGDDLANIRGSRRSIVRDNVVFELGLFLGKLGKDRAWWLSPVNRATLRTITDLEGIEHLTYSVPKGSKRSGLASSLSDVTAKIRRQVERLGAKTQRAVDVLDRIRVLCASSSEYPEEKFEDDIKEIQRNFPPGSVEQVRRVSADVLATCLRPGNEWDIIHLAANVDGESGDLVLPDPDRQKANPLRDRFPRSFLLERIQESRARLVVIPACESILLAARIARVTNAIAAIHKLELKSVINWAKEFYWYLAQGCSLNESFNRAQPLDPCLLLITRHDFRLSLAIGKAATTAN